MSTNAAHLLRPNKTADEIARGFAGFCKQFQIITRGMVKVGKTPRGLRGVVANKDIKKDEVCIAVPHNAFLSLGSVARDVKFVHMLNGNEPGSTAPVPQQPGSLRLNGLPAKDFSERVGGTFIFNHQIVLGLYLADMMLENSSTNPFMHYLDYLPRSEGNFSELMLLLERSVDHAPLAVSGMEKVATRHRVRMSEVKGVLVYCLSMIISRAVPIEHVPTLNDVLSGTEYLDLFRGLPDEQQTYSLPILCPLIDMINHSNTEENVAVMVPRVQNKTTGEQSGTKCVVARALKDINKGQEVIMQYGGVDPNYLRMFYGMDTVL